MGGTWVSIALVLVATVLSFNLQGTDGHQRHHHLVKPNRVGKPRNRPTGRHVCLQNNVVTKPVKQIESYCKPVYKSHMYPCEKDTNKFCTSFRVVYEKAFRTVFKITAQKEEQYTCCPGWAKQYPSATGCNKPVCTQTCANGASCTKPDHCTCVPGWSGKSCEDDVDECKDQSIAGKCEHKCSNTPGSFKCTCHDGFMIDSDGIGCKININIIPEITEFIQSYEELSRKVQALEKAQEEQQNPTELVERLDNLTIAVDSLREQMDSKADLSQIMTTTSTTTKPPEIVTTTSTTTTTTAAPSTDFDSRYGSPWDRINSLSEQISMLEERLEDCTCNPAEGYNFGDAQK